MLNLILRIALTAALTFAGIARAADLPVTGKGDPSMEQFDHFMLEYIQAHQVPGASLAIAREGKLIYARGFGFADVDKAEPVQPDSLFRIASISKPFTATAIFQLAERGKIKLDDPAFPYLNFTPHLGKNGHFDPRLAKVTIRQLLDHTGGFDRDASFDPMFRPIEIADALHVPPPAGPKEIIEYMMGKPLDFDPGTRQAYSNFGYCVLGRVIEKASGMPYADYVKQEILSKLGIHRMRIGHTLENQRADGEVRYYVKDNPMDETVLDHSKTKVPVQYGGFYIEAMDSHGAWLATATELVRFGSSFADPAHSPLLSAASIEDPFKRPPGTEFSADGKKMETYYADGWNNRPLPVGRNLWHTGLLDGTATELMRRHDGVTWAILFNTNNDEKGEYLLTTFAPKLQALINEKKDWPAGSDFVDEK